MALILKNAKHILKFLSFFFNRPKVHNANSDTSVVFKGFLYNTIGRKTENN